jgi:hypothetical protein
MIRVVVYLVGRRIIIAVAIVSLSTLAPFSAFSTLAPLSAFSTLASLSSVVVALAAVVVSLAMIVMPRKRHTKRFTLGHCWTP